MNITKKNRFGRTLVGLSLSLSIAFTGTLIATPKSAHAAEAAVASTTSSASKANSIIALGKKYMGAPYKFGAKTGNTSSFDCSSFTQYLYKKYGINLPRSSKDQAKSGFAVSKSNLKPGDLVFSDTNRDGKINHVSIYIGNDKLLHTYRKGIGVTISKFSGSSWDKTFVKARRVIN